EQLRGHLGPFLHGACGQVVALHAGWLYRLAYRGRRYRGGAARRRSGWSRCDHQHRGGRGRGPHQRLGRYRVLSPLSTFTLPADNVFGLAPGDYQYILEGFFLLLAPPAVGEHVIHLHDEFPGGISDVTYNITVAPRGAK